jgi:hypothetical protein
VTGVQTCALPIFIALLKDDDWQVRMAAALALGIRKDKSARDGLIELFLSEKDELIYENRKELIWFVHKNDEASIERLDNIPFNPQEQPEWFAAWSRRWRLKGHCANALGYIGGEDVEKLLIESVKDGQDFQYYVCVCKALRSCGTALSLPLLYKFLEFNEVCTQKFAQDAINEINKRIALKERIQK